MREKIMSTTLKVATQPIPAAGIARVAGIAAGRWWVAYTTWRIDRLMAATLAGWTTREINRPDDASVPLPR